jgi:hypothetical protein
VFLIRSLNRQEWEELNKKTYFYVKLYLIPCMYYDSFIGILMFSKFGDMWLQELARVLFISLNNIHLRNVILMFHIENYWY